MSITCFLNGDLEEEEVYMQLSQGCKVSNDKNSNKNLVCKLQRSLYGLQQASRQWYAKFSNFLISLGLNNPKQTHHYLSSVMVHPLFLF